MAIEAQFYGSNNLMVFFNSQQYKHNLQQSGQQQWLHQARQMTQNTSLVDPVFSSFSNSNAQMNAFHKYNHNAQPLASYPHQSFATQLDEQREIDHYIRSQNEKLRVFLQEQRKQHMAELLKKMEWNALHLLRQKDEEIVEAAKKTRELKEFLTRLEVEKESWRKVAEENEAMVLCLHNNIERMKERAVHGMTSEDAESCCDDNVGITASMGEGTGEKRGRRGGVGEIEEIRKKTMDCKRCNSQKSCFMFLPCRHLCSCKTCEPFLQVCPVCSTPSSVVERNLLADTSKIVDNNSKVYKRKDDLRKIVTESLSSLGYDSSICTSKWDKTPTFPAGEYEYIDVIVEGERLIIDIDFRSEFDIARSTGTYKAILQSLPFIFVGKSDRLCQIVASVSEAAKQSLKKKGMHVPPWRKADYMLAKWLSNSCTRVNPPSSSSSNVNGSTENLSVGDGAAAESDCGELELIFGEKISSPGLEICCSGERNLPPVATPSWQPPALKVRSLERGTKVVTGLASLLKDKP